MLRTSSLISRKKIQKKEEQEDYICQSVRKPISFKLSLGLVVMILIPALVLILSVVVVHSSDSSSGVESIMESRFKLQVLKTSSFVKDLYPLVELKSYLDMREDLPKCQGHLSSKRVYDLLESGFEYSSKQAQGSDCVPILVAENRSDGFRAQGVTSNIEIQVLVHGNSEGICFPKINTDTESFVSCISKCLSDKRESCDGSDEYCRSNPCSPRSLCFCFMASLEEYQEISVGEEKCYSKSSNFSLEYMCKQSKKSRDKRSLSLFQKKEELPTMLSVIQKAGKFYLDSDKEYPQEFSFSVRSVPAGYDVNMNHSLPVTIEISPEIRAKIHTLLITIFRGNQLVFNKAVELQIDNDCERVMKSGISTKLQNSHCVLKEVYRTVWTIKNLVIATLVLIVIAVLAKVKSFIEDVYSTLSFLYKRIKIAMQYIVRKIRGERFYYLPITSGQLESDSTVIELSPTASTTSSKSSSSSRVSRKKAVGLGALGLMGSLPSAEMCTLNSLVPISLSNCDASGSTETCRTSVEITLSLSNLGETSCFNLVDSNSPFNPLSIEVSYDALNCHYALLEDYCTSSWTSTVYGTSKCNAACGKMDSPRTYNPYGLIGKDLMNLYGVTGCNTVPGCWANACVSCYSAIALYRWTVTPVPTFFRVSSVAGRVCKPSLTIKVKSQKHTLIEKQISGLEPGHATSLDELATIQLIGAYTGVEDNLATYKVVSLLNGTTRYLMRDVSERGKPVMGMVGDIQMDCDKVEWKSDQGVMFQDSAVRCIADRNSQDCSFTKPGILALSKKDVLPVLLSGISYSMKGEELVSSMSYSRPVSLFFKTKKDFQVTRTIGSVCPEVSLIAITGFKSSAKGVRISVSARSTCSPGLVTVGFSGIEFQILTPTLSLLTEEHTFNVNGFTTSDQITGVLSFKAENGRTVSMNIDFKPESDSDKRIETEYHSADVTVNNRVKEDIFGTISEAFGSIGSWIGGLFSGFLVSIVLYGLGIGIIWLLIKKFIMGSNHPVKRD